MNELITTLGTILGLALIMVARDIRDGKNPFKRDISLGQRMDTLSNHFNHETTEILREIRAGVDSSNQLLRELKEYGIRCRNDA